LLSSLDVIVAIVYPPAYVVVDQLFDAINEVAEVTVQVCRTFDTTNNREQHAERLYCLLEEDGTLTEAAWNEYISNPEYFDFEVARYVFFDLLGSYEVPAILARASYGQYADGGVCVGFDCSPGWCYEWTFINDDGNWYPASAFYSGSSWSDANDRWEGFNNGPNSVLGISIDFPESSTVTKVEVRHSANHAAGGATRQVTTNLGVYGNLTTATAGFYEDTISLEQIGVTRLNIVTGTVNQINDNVFIENVRMWGEGENPFGSDNFDCES